VEPSADSTGPAKIVCVGLNLPGNHAAEAGRRAPGASDPLLRSGRRRSSARESRFMLPPVTPGGGLRSGAGRSSNRRGASANISEGQALEGRPRLRSAVNEGSSAGARPAVLSERPMDGAPEVRSTRFLALSARVSVPRGREFPTPPGRSGIRCHLERRGGLQDSSDRGE